MVVKRSLNLYNDDSRRRLFLAPIVVPDRHPAPGVRPREEGLKRRLCSHSSRFGLERWRGDGADGRSRGARLLSCRADR